MKIVAEHHAPGRSNVLNERFSGLDIPWKRIGLYATLSLGFFLLGSVPMWLKASRAIEQRDAAQREVRLIQLQNTIGAAMVAAERGQHELARQMTSDFYIKLRSQTDAGSSSIFTPAQRETLKPLLAERDEVITLLARSDPTSTERLFAIYSSYRKVTSNGG